VKLIDTTVAIDHLRGTEPAVKLLTGLVEEGQTLVSSELVRFELLAGLPEDLVIERGKDLPQKRKGL